jgi:hypothetical protein
VSSIHAEETTTLVVSKAAAKAVLLSRTRYVDRCIPVR